MREASASVQDMHPDILIKIVVAASDEREIGWGHGSSMSGIDQAVWQFSAERLEKLAQGVISELRTMPASGIYGDDAESWCGARLRNLWDEFRYEVHFGPHDLLDRPWRATIDPFIEAAIASVTPAERQLLFLATNEGVQFDTCSDEPPPPIDDTTLKGEVTAVLHDFAANDTTDSEFFRIRKSDEQLIKYDIVELLTGQLHKLSPYELHSVATMLLGISRLPSITAGLSVQLRFSQPNTDGNHGWVEISMTEEDFTLGIGEHYHDPTVGGDTESSTLFEVGARGNVGRGDIEHWLEHARARALDGSLNASNDTNYQSLDWFDDGTE